MDCAHSVYATDQLVCTDSALRTLDTEMTQRVAQMGQRTPWRDAAWFENQHKWLSRRSRCAFQQDHRACATAAFCSRLIELDAVLGPLPVLWPMQCGTMDHKPSLEMAITSMKRLRVSNRQRKRLVPLLP